MFSAWAKVLARPRRVQAWPSEPQKVLACAPMQSVIAVTGSSGNLGRALIPRLANDPKVERIIALDRVPPPAGSAHANHPKVEFRRCDIRDDDLGRCLRDAGAVVHLAFIVHRGPGGLGDDEIDAVNIGGTKNVARAVAAAGIRQLVYASSLAAYGFHADNWGKTLTEDDPLRGNPEFFYTRTKAACEHFLAEFAGAHPDIAVARLRPCAWLGSAGDLPVLVRRQPLFPYFTFDPTPAQLAHISDVVQAFYLALAHNARGAFNIATEDPLPMRELARCVGKLALPIPEAAMPLVGLGYRAGVVTVDPGWFRATAGGPIIAASAKIRRVLRWRPLFDSAGMVLREALGCPTVLASRTTKIILGGLSAITRARGSLPVTEREQQELAHTHGKSNLILTGSRPSEWHLSFQRGAIGVHTGLATDSAATVLMAEDLLHDLFRGHNDWASAAMTGKIRIRGGADYGLLIGGVIAGIRRLIDSNTLPARLATRMLFSAQPKSAAKPASTRTEASP